MVPRGVALPARLLESWVRAVAGAHGGEVPYDEVAGPTFDALIGPDGLDAVGALAHRADCAPAPELLRLA